MNNAYEIEDYIKEASHVGQKTAKIHQLKFNKLRENYNIRWKTLASSVKAPVLSNPTVGVVSNIQPNSSNVVPFPSVTNVSVLPQSVESPVTQTTFVNDNVVSTDKLEDKHNRVSKMFNVTVYNKNYQISTLYLNGARKIRTSQDTKNKTNEYSNSMGIAEFGNIVLTSTSESSIGTNSDVATAIQTPSVDNYFQNHGSSTTVSSDIAVLIKQEEEKIAKLKEERDLKSKQLQEKRFEKEQRQKAIILQQLKEEALGLTQAIKIIDEEMIKEDAEIVSMNHAR